MHEKQIKAYTRLLVGPGNTVFLPIPQIVLHALRLKDGDHVSVDARPDGTMVLQKVQP